MRTIMGDDYREMVRVIREAIKEAFADFSMVRRDTPEAWMSAKEFGQCVGLSQQSVLRMVRVGQLRRLDMAGHPKIPASELERFRAARRT
jgi:hypothetical protein